jgi:hypothetical protein
VPSCIIPFCLERRPGGQNASSSFDVHFRREAIIGGATKAKDPRRRGRRRGAAISDPRRRQLLHVHAKLIGAEPPTRCSSASIVMAPSWGSIF